ncbi:GNAT family N-acetyltransferase [Chlorogloeopsis fritschii PCC 9212]|uniref:N-acetyltransferase n=2 Tax=Chlorogloeopsis fritschii TaxID=1124 RepID=A0A433NBE3_CHLFR|nr:N-acetyltransferase [Chlorogloeopsis fritschii]RUR79235.1 N-acetyltransferase [Chlorogloeopsis fritschii PCC 6912]
MLDIIPETNEEIANIRQVVTDAFAQPQEAQLVDKIRNSENFIPELSLMAVENGKVLGHILFNRIFIEASQQTLPALALAPLAVIPQRQHQGIGTRLVQVGLSKCRELDYAIVVVVGYPHYYQRFGFQTASKFGLMSSLSVPDEAFMVLELKRSALAHISGTVHYPAYFQEV